MTLRGNGAGGWDARILLNEKRGLTRIQKKLRNTPYDPELHLDYELNRIDDVKRSPHRPYIRLWLAEFLEQRTVAISTGRLCDRNDHRRMSLLDSDWARALAWEWLFSEQARDLWDRLRAAGARLRTYDEFARKVVAEINARIERARSEAA